MSEFPWHTDCSYEDRPPRYLAFHVLQHDRYGGGTLSVMNVKSLSEYLSLTTRVSPIRFRNDIMKALSKRAHALEELKEILQNRSVQSQLTLHLSSEDLPKGSVVLIDNRRWLHARNRINDPECYLRRVRWDAVPFKPDSS